MSKDSKSGIWFPSNYQYEDLRKGKLYRSHEVTIDVVSLNKELPDKVFSLEGMELIKSGTPVQWELNRERPGDGKLIWNGKKILSEGDFITENIISKTNSKRLTSVLLINIIVISLIAFLITRRAYMRRRES